MPTIVKKSIASISTFFICFAPIENANVTAKTKAAKIAPNNKLNNINAGFSIKK